MDVNESETTFTSSITTQNIGLAAGALAAYPKAKLQAESATPGAPLIFTVTGLPEEFSAEVARGAIKVPLRDMLSWTAHLLSLVRTSKRQGGRA